MLKNSCQKRKEKKSSGFTAKEFILPRVPNINGRKSPAHASTQMFYSGIQASSLEKKVHLPSILVTADDDDNPRDKGSEMVFPPKDLMARLPKIDEGKLAPPDLDRHLLRPAFYRKTKEFVEVDSEGEKVRNSFFLPDLSKSKIHFENKKTG